MSKSTLEYLHHIISETSYLLEHCGKLTYDDFVGDETLKRAFTRSIEIIGEATKNVPESFRTQHPDIEWRSIAGMRDKLIHHYFGVDYEIVWDVIVNKIPILHQQIKQILSAEES